MLVILPNVPPLCSVCWRKTPEPTRDKKGRLSVSCCCGCRWNYYDTLGWIRISNAYEPGPGELSREELIKSVIARNLNLCNPKQDGQD